MAIQEQKEMAINSIRKAQIKVQTQAQVEVLLLDEALIAVLIKYSNYSNIFLAENIAKLLKYTRINNHIIELVKGKQLFFGPIYSLKLVELKTLKIYIETNLANGFI